MPKIKIAALGINKEHTFTLPQKTDDGKDIDYITIPLASPMGATARCEVKTGGGQFSLYKNGRWVGSTYLLSTDSGYPASVEFRTLTTREEYALKKTKVKSQKKGKKVVWELYVAMLATEQPELKFQVKLVPRNSEKSGG